MDHQQDRSKWLIVIPARLRSERLPQKPLVDLAGKPLIVRVYENLTPLAGHGARIVVAVDHNDTAKACERFKIPFVMTKDTHPSGTDRCEEVAQGNPDRPFVLNVQGDEPFVSLDDLGRLMISMENAPYPMGTLGLKRDDWESYIDPNIVKIATASDQTAIYFSRAPIPFDRESFRKNEKKATFTQHLGVYAFRRDKLREFRGLAASPLEQIEKLEQLRAIAAGWKIFVAEAKSPSIGIDTPEDLDRAREKFHV
jgi:3-deoxy-manno-octulosonate cytidylyltransferase (CMP-KDO synthetase)